MVSVVDEWKEVMWMTWLCPNFLSMKGRDLKTNDLLDELYRVMKRVFDVFDHVLIVEILGDGKRVVP